jgi:hypothetical protein
MGGDALFIQEENTMTREQHRAPGRLAPPHAQQEWEPHSPPPTPPSRAPAYETEYRTRHIDEPDAIDDGQYQRGASARYRAPSIAEAEPATVYVHDQDTDEAYEERTQPIRTWRQDGDEAEPEPLREPIPFRRASQPPVEMGELPRRERQLLLMRAIRLYDDVWKLAGIRANPKDQKLYAYMVPRNKRYELKEAISKNKVLIITVDRHGNTDIKEPKRRGPWRKLVTWLIGE